MVTEPIYMPAPTKPEAVVARPPTAEQHAREIYGLPSDWEAVVWTAEGEVATGYLVLEGGVFKTPFLRGPRKGQTNLSKPEPGTQRTVSVPNPLHRDWLAQWERELGFCHRCSGTGYALHGWNHKLGTSYRTCTRCGASGNAPCVAEAAE